MRDGRLSPCKRSPNCVCSQADPADAEHYIAPLHASLEEVRKALQAMPRATVVSQRPDYLYAEVRTPLLRFVDDVEFFFDGSLVQVRSCSRLGRRDFGVNRRRVEALRRLVEASR